MKKKFLLLVATLFMCSSFAFGFSACTIPSGSSSNGESSSQEETIERESVVSEGLTFELLENDTYQVVRIGTCMDKELVIPSTYNGKAVTAIGDYAFAGNNRLTGVEIPDSIKSIGTSAFGVCINLKNIYITSIEAWCNIEFAYNGNPLPYVDKLYLNNVLVTNLKIPDSVTTIGDSAFTFYKNLTSVELGDGVTTIGNSAFSGCANLTSISMGDSITSIGENAFFGCSALQCKEYGNAQYLGNKTNDYFALIQAKAIFSNNYKIHDDTKIIAGGAFSSSSGLKSITIPDSVTYIGENAFQNSYGLAFVTIGKGVKVIGASAFNGCSLQELHVKDIEAWCNISFGDSAANPLSIANKVYLNDTVLTELTIPDGITRIGEYAFKNCKILTSVVMPDSVTSIGDFAFSNCTNLASITIPSGVTSIGDSAFYDCDSLASVVIPDSVTSIGQKAFYNCRRLTSATIPDNVTSIGDYAFYYCNQLTSLTIGTGVQSIGKEAFYSCQRLTSLEIPGNVTSIGDSAFYNCYNLTSLTISEGVTSIGDSAFDNCYSLTSLTIPNSVTSIGNNAFNGCSALVSVTIGKNVTSIGENAFAKCSGLASMIISEDNTAYASVDNILYNKAKTKILFVPKAITGEVKIAHGITSIEATTFAYCSNLTSLEIPSSVTSIHENAFENCSGLMNITVSEDNATYASQDGILYNKAKTEIVSIPKNITGDVELASGITSIGNQAFYRCYNLTSIKIPDSVTSIGSEAFAVCSKLTSVTFGNGLTSIGAAAFTYCSSLTSVEIPDSGVSIGAWAFERCENLTSVTIPESVVFIGLYAFRDCKNLQYNEYGNAKYLGNATNAYCALMTIVDKNLSDFTFLSDTKIIAGSALENCVNLTSVVLGKGVNFIGDSAFKYCNALTSVYYLGTAEDWSNIEMGSYNSKLTSATIYYYIEKEEDVPTDGGNYWHYGKQGEIVVWTMSEES